MNEAKKNDMKALYIMGFLTDGIILIAFLGMLSVFMITYIMFKMLMRTNPMEIELIKDIEGMFRILFGKLRSQFSEK